MCVCANRVKYSVCPCGLSVEGSTEGSVCLCIHVYECTMCSLVCVSYV